MKNKFILCGIIGWCMEILWTGLHSFCKKELRLVANTSIWMFPIYGMACVISPVSGVLKKNCTAVRGGIYALCIFAGEYLTGSFLKKLNICPWDYSKAKLNIKGVIRLDYAPVWFLAGLIFEKILKGSEKVS